MKVKEFKKTVKVFKKLLKGVNHPYLEVVKFKRYGGIMLISGTNLESSFVKTVIDRDDTLDFTGFINIMDLAKVGKAIKGDTVSIEPDQSSDQYKLVFAGKNSISVNYADFDNDDISDISPDIYGIYDKYVRFGLPAEKPLFEAIKKMAISTTKHNVNHSYSGILFDSQNKCLVSTDIHRLSVVEIPGLDIPESVVLDMSFLKEMISKKSGDLLSIIKSETYTSFCFSDETWITRNIKNEFPRWETVTGTDFDYISDSINVSSFKEIISGYADLYNKKGSNPVKITFSCNNADFFCDTGGITLQESMEFETSLEKVTAWNIPYLKEIFNTFSTDQVALYVKPEASLTPMFLKEITPDYTFIHCLMPLRF